jgi:hypothetical protein
MLFPFRGVLLATVLGLLSAAPARAQLLYDIPLAPEQAQAFRPQLVFVARVVDARANTLRLARLPRGVEQEVGGFYDQVLRGYEARPLVMVIRRLGLAEQYATLQEVALAEVVADFYYQHTDGYHLVHHATELTSTRGFDATSLLSETLGRALLQALAPLNSLSPEQATAAPALAWEQVLAAPAPGRYPVQQAQALAAGVYRTVADFQQNQPLAGVAWKARPALGLLGTPGLDLKVQGDVPGGWHDGLALWGFCDGQQVYVRHAKSFYALTRTPEGFSYQAPVYADSRQRSSAVIYTPGVVYTKNSPAVLFTTLQLWPDTGFATEELPQNTRADAPAPTATVTVYRRADAAPDRAVQILLNGQAAGSLGPGQYLTLTVPAGAADISVCGLTEREACFRFRPDLLAPNYLDCRLGTTTQPAPTLRLISAEMGAAAVRECVEAR